jgi:hypothetical protein
VPDRAQPSQVRNRIVQNVVVLSDGFLAARVREWKGSKAPSTAVGPGRVPTAGRLNNVFREAVLAVCAMLPPLPGLSSSTLFAQPLHKAHHGGVARGL